MARRALSLRGELLLGILLPVLFFVGFNTFSLYRTLSSLHTAYDRTLPASAKSISEQLDVSGYDDVAELRATVPYSALEAFEADNQSHMFYRISNLRGDLISGYAALPVWRGLHSGAPAVRRAGGFYNDQFEGRPVRAWPCCSNPLPHKTAGMAVIQVAETLEVRHALALQILWHTLARAPLIAVIALTVLIVVQRATRPVRQLSAALQARPEGDS